MLSVGLDTLDISRQCIVVEDMSLRLSRSLTELFVPSFYGSREFTHVLSTVKYADATRR